MPTLTIFAGPNGSGKSSVIRRSFFAGQNNLLAADAVADRIRAPNRQHVAVSAGREVLRRTVECLALQQDFAIETTLSGSWIVRTVQDAVAQAFFVQLVFICLDNPEQNIQRVRERVAQGGHDVPEQDIRRRYVRSLAKLKEVLKVVDEVLLYDNSGIGPRLIAEIRSGKLVSKSEKMPDWAYRLLSDMPLFRSREST